MKKDMFEAYMNAYKDNVYAIALNSLRSPYDANDVVQNTFLKLYCTLKRFENEEHVRNWLIRVAINECNKLWKKKKMLQEQPFDEWIESLAVETQEQGALFAKVMELEESYRMVLHLYYFEEYSTKEIGKLLKISDVAVRKRLSRARSILRENWEKEV